MKKFSGSWLEDEYDQTIRQIAGTESQVSSGKSGTSGGSEAQGPEDENKADITPMEAFNAVTMEGDALLGDMHGAAMAFPNTFDKCLNNMELNRIPHLYCYDHSRVELTPKNGTGDYYHASWVDGYNKKCLSS
ncbi:hypothetical protein CAEBREN_02468 [Caenorhabditis brenneri]|uniref:Tyrosine-protein phosphatase domain-containing protein n=1 Tax=Caenorhabditis brenneri TaxID=135651 RepID=G0N5J9_CAEBE|nr:hypothetical protein CAEBREN_02468 [Caenorhabditis brenneri]